MIIPSTNAMPNLFYQQLQEESESKSKPEDIVKEAAALLKQYYDALVEQGFTNSQAFQLLIEEVKANTYGAKP